MLNYFLTCQSECSPDVHWGSISQLQDCTSYPVLDSQVSDLVLVPFCADDPFSWADPDTPAYLANSIDNTNTTGTKAKRLVGRGGVAIPEKNVESLPRNRKVIHRKVYTLTLEVLNMSDDQYAFLRQLQCGWLGFTFYYLNLGGFMFGEQGGIKPLFMDVDFPLGSGNSDKQRAVLTIEWEADGDPNRYLLGLNDTDDFGGPGIGEASEAVGLPTEDEVVGPGTGEAGEVVGPGT